MVIIAGGNTFRGILKTFEFVPNDEKSDEFEDLHLKFDLVNGEVIDVKFPKVPKSIKESFIRLRMAGIKNATVDLNKKTVSMEGVQEASKKGGKTVTRPKGATATIIRN